MADLQEELSALRIQIAALTSRIHRLEQRAGLTSEPAQQATGGPPVPLRAVVPPARNTYEGFIFTFPGTAATTVSEISTDNQSLVAAFGGLAYVTHPMSCHFAGCLS